MSLRMLLLLVVVALFGLLTVEALLDVGYVGIFTPHFQSWGGGQVLADLVVMGALVCIWMVRDAPRHGLSSWPFVVATLLAGSFGPLAYLIVREVRAVRPAVRA